MLLSKSFNFLKPEAECLVTSGLGKTHMAFRTFLESCCLQRGQPCLDSDLTLISDLLMVFADGSVINICTASLSLLKTRRRVNWFTGVVYWVICTHSINQSTDYNGSRTWTDGSAVLSMGVQARIGPQHCSQAFVQDARMSSSLQNRFFCVVTLKDQHRDTEG